MIRFPSGKKKPQVVRPLPAVQKFHVATVDVHAENLIALIGRTSGLEDDFRAVVRKVCFSILTAES